MKFFRKDNDDFFYSRCYGSWIHTEKKIDPILALNISSTFIDFLTKIKF